MRDHSYHNTTRETGRTLVKKEIKALTQEERILAHFAKNKNILMTPSQVWDHMQEYPLTSVRRGISNLTRLGPLERTDNFREGIYGAREHCWVLPSGEPVQGKLL